MKGHCLELVPAMLAQERAKTELAQNTSVLAEEQSKWVLAQAQEVRVAVRVEERVEELAVVQAEEYTRVQEAQSMLEQQAWESPAREGYKQRPAQHCQAFCGDDRSGSQRKW